MLYIVATPIGNLEDITIRAIKVLRLVDIIAAEDTRHTRKLLTRYRIKTRLFSFHEHSAADKLERLLDMLKEGRDVALVSDAGTPLISDPGAVLVEQAVMHGIAVTSLPGACAAITALTLSGQSGPFCFLGFLSKKASERRKQISDIVNSEIRCVIYESPHALSRCLEELRDAAGEQRQVTVAKELTKLYEHVFRGSLKQACQAFGQENKGEYVVIIEACKKTPEVSDAQISAAIDAYLAQGMTKKDAAVAASIELGISKNKAYRLTL